MNRKSSTTFLLALIFITFFLNVKFGFSDECPEGYGMCQESGECERVGTLSEGAPCKCYFQCKTNYCSDVGACTKAMDIIFSSKKDVIKLGEGTEISISANNALDQDVKAKLTINVGTGASMSGIISGQHCSGNQCTTSVAVPAGSRSDVTITVMGESSGDVELVATVTATIDERLYQKSQNMTIKITECGDGKCEKGETKENCCKDCGCPSDDIAQCVTYSCVDNKCEKKTNSSCLFNKILMEWILVPLVVLALFYSLIRSILRGR